MQSETGQDTFGSYLKDFRIKQHLAIETVARHTKISVGYLTAIEENDHDRLPPQAYIKGFIRTYANAVGANADVAVNLYRLDLEQQTNIEQQKLRRRAKLRMTRRVLMAAGVIAGIVLLLRYSDIFPDPAPPSVTEAPALDIPPEPLAAQATTSEIGLPATRTQSKLKLQIVAVEQTWLKVIVDNQNARSYNLKPEDRLELEGTNNFNLMIGNATGVQIFLDEQPVKIFGSKGQVVSLKIP